MYLLKNITIKNFKGFREKTTFELSDGSYFCGTNNSGKTSVLNAIHFFFNESLFIDESFINKTSFLSKKGGSNKVEISIEFNLEALSTVVTKQRLIKAYGHVLKVKKEITVTTDTKIISFLYSINGKKLVDTLHSDIEKLIKSVKITYLHPQEGKELLFNAQTKLRQRLLANWGRGSNITQSIKELQEAWENLRNKSRDYLSKALTDDIQNIWPSSEVLVNLPKDIKDIIAVSDINFIGYKNAPDIELTAQGTGAQSIILYLIHFLLDSDRSLHRGEYHPVWLLEEPESFLHANLIARLTSELNSEKWLGNIQMIISTHSPILLAGSRLAEEKIIWSILENHIIKSNKKISLYQDDEIKNIGKMMGDPNFHLYFLAAQKTPIIFIEDGKDLTLKRYIEAGVSVFKGLKGVGEVAKHLDVYSSSPSISAGKMFFIVDADKGKDELSRFYDEEKALDTKAKFKKFAVKDTIDKFIILLPEGFAAEDLFSEFDNHLEESVSKIWNTSTWDLLENVPSVFLRTIAKIRKIKPSSKEDAKILIKNTDDVKVRFWEKVEKDNLKFKEAYSKALQDLIA